MKTAKELKMIFESCPWAQVDAHVHTHRCDGRPEMTVQNIAARAEKTGVRLIVLTPHFHKRVEDETETLYEDTDPAIFIELREEIDFYRRGGGSVRFLLSTEADILSADGEISLQMSYETERALDLITPTMNYHPLLPLKAVHLTYGRDIDGLHDSGEYARMAAAAGGLDVVVETIYMTEANAVKRAPCPAMLGHFLAAHSVANERYSWFGMQERQEKIMRTGAAYLLEACRKTGCMIDLTGIHLRNETPAHKREKDGFLYGFQRWFLEKCREEGVPAWPGSDAHSLEGVGSSLYYAEIFG